MKKLFFILTILISSQYLFSQSVGVPKKNTQEGFAKIDFLSIDMPEFNIPNEANMGYTGIHYNLMLDKTFYTGVGIYGAVSGLRGGFFTLGVNAGIKKNISEKLYLDTGFHFGGGGGAGAPDGGGAFILPHFNLGYNFKSFSINSGWSYVNFFDKGLIKSHQLNFGLEIPLNFEYADSKSSEIDLNINTFKNSGWNQNSNKTSMMLHFNNLKVTKAEATKEEVIQGKTIKLAGFEFANYFSKNWFAFLKVDGAYSGIRAGYMDVFLGGGYHLSFNKNSTNIIGKFGIGAGGGGGVNSDGGFMLYPDLSIEQRIYNDIFISLNKGYLLTPSSLFSTSSFGLGIKYYVDKNGTLSENKTYTSGKFKGIDIILKQDLYFNAKRMTNPTEDMHQISLQINLNLNKHLYVAGQTSFANFGNAGAYAEGLVGLGIKSNVFFNESTTIFSQILSGAAGGGNISTGQGLIIKPSLGVNYQLNTTTSLTSALGYVKAKGGDLSSPFVNIGIKYSFSFLNMK